MAKQKLFFKKVSRKPFYIGLFGFVLVYLLALFAFMPFDDSQYFSNPNLIDRVKFKFVGIYYTLFPQALEQKIANYPAFNTPVPTSAALKIPVTEKPLVSKEFISQELGISFSFAPDVGKQHFSARRIGNFIYLYLDREPYLESDNDFLANEAKGAKYIEVIKKDPGQDLVPAIKEHIIKGTAADFCSIKTQTNYGTPRIDESYERAVIWASPSSNPNQSYDERIAQLKECTEYVSNLYGVSYFLMSPQHPDRFLYIKIGQDNTTSGIKGYSWDKTIKIF